MGFEKGRAMGTDMPGQAPCSVTVPDVETEDGRASAELSSMPRTFSDPVEGTPAAAGSKGAGAAPDDAAQSAQEAEADGCAAGATSPDKKRQRRWCVAAEGVSVREQPGSGTVLGTLEKGERFTELDSHGDWVLHRDGWIPLTRPEDGTPVLRLSEPHTAAAPEAASEQPQQQQQEEEKDQQHWKCVFGDGMYVRAEPASAADTCGELDHNNVITELEQRDGWVRFDKGWVRISAEEGTVMLKKVRLMPKWEVVRPTGVRVREKPSLSAPLVGSSLCKSATLTELERQDDWIRIEKGWVCTLGADQSPVLEQRESEYVEEEEARPEEDKPREGATDPLMITAHSPRDGGTAAGAAAAAGPEEPLTTRYVPGLCGLSNLGNTCFMNSGIQCLSNSPELRDYFLPRRSGSRHAPYERHINTENPLGTKGRLAHAFAKLMDKMWSGHESSVSPWDLKQAIQDLQPRFAGGAQHDSQELVGYLLDGLHEDTNRVLHKKFVEAPDGTPPQDPAERQAFERDAAAGAWQRHLDRNHSRINELFMGLLRSQLRCNECGREALQFDPAMNIQVPVTTEQQRFKVYNITFAPNPREASFLKLAVKLRKEATARQLRDAVSELTRVPAADLVLTETDGDRPVEGRVALSDSATVGERDKDVYVARIPAADLAGAPDPAPTECPGAAADVLAGLWSTPGKYSTPLETFYFQLGETGEYFGAGQGCTTRSAKVKPLDQERLEKFRREEEWYHSVPDELPEEQVCYFGTWDEPNNWDKPTHIFLRYVPPPAPAPAPAAESAEAPTGGDETGGDVDMEDEEKEPAVDGKEAGKEKDVDGTEGGKEKDGDGTAGGKEIDGDGKPPEPVPAKLHVVILQGRREEKFRVIQAQTWTRACKEGEAENTTVVAAVGHQLSYYESRLPVTHCVMRGNTADRDVCLAVLETVRPVPLGESRTGGGAAPAAADTPAADLPAADIPAPAAGSPAPAAEASGDGMDLDDADSPREAEKMLAVTVTSWRGQLELTLPASTSVEEVANRCKLVRNEDLYYSSGQVLYSTDKLADLSSEDGSVRLTVICGRSAGPYPFRLKHGNYVEMGDGDSALPELLTKRIATVCAGDRSQEDRERCKTISLTATWLGQDLLDLCRVSVDEHPSVKELKQWESECSGKALDLVQCLARHDEEEQLDEDNGWYCPSCKKHVMAYKQLSMWRPPKYLIVQLKRFSFTRSNYFYSSYYSNGVREKLSTPVDFPLEGLDMMPHLSEGSPWRELCRSGGLVYDLYAVSNHSGYASGGHYTAHCKNSKTQEWYSFNDSWVSKVDRDTVAGNNVEAYLLFYQLRGDGWDSGTASPIPEGDGAESDPSVAEGTV